MSPVFSGGPLDGQIGYSQQAGDPPPEVLAARVGADSEGPGDQGAADIPASQKFDRILSDARGSQPRTASSRRRTS